MQTIAIILAAGSGRRVGGSIPKQLVQVLGQPLLHYSLQAFNSHPAIEHLLVVANPLYLKEIEQVAHPFSKVLDVIEGGEERWQSSLNAIQYLINEGFSDAHLLIHDAARPLVSGQIIDAVLAGLVTHCAVTPAIPVTDTIVSIYSDNTLNNFPPRASLMALQTPQGFRLPTLTRAYKLLMASGHLNVTDDCSVIKQAFPQQNIALVAGSPRNFKITTQQDIDYFQFLLHYEHND